MLLQRVAQLTEAFVVLLLVVTAAKKDHYQILGLKSNANSREIKRQFHRLALKYHPDKNRDPNAEMTFRSMTEAYEVLRDPNKRRLYDAQRYSPFTLDPTSSADFDFEVNDLFKKLGESIAQFSEIFQKVYEKSYEQLRQGNFDFDHLFGQKHQPTCQMIPKKRGNTIIFVEECS